MSIERTFIQLGPLTIHFYGIIIMVGVVLAAMLAARLAKRNGEDPEVVWDMLPIVLITGIIGARLWHILTPPPSMGITPMYYFTHPLEALAIWKGGLGILGAVIGGAIGAWLYMRRHNMSFLRWADFIAPGLALAQAIGRWGNFVNQELYGAPTDLPWGLYIDPAHRYPGFEQFERYHPTFLYESILNLVNMGLLLWVGRRFRGRLKTGDVFLVYLITYPVIRFFMEFLRLDSPALGGINVNQYVMLAIALASAAFLIARHTILNVKAEEVEDEPEAGETGPLVDNNVQ